MPGGREGVASKHRRCLRGGQHQRDCRYEDGETPASIYGGRGPWPHHNRRSGRCGYEAQSRRGSSVWPRCDVIELTQDQIRPVPQISTSLDADFITGIANHRHPERETHPPMV